MALVPGEVPTETQRQTHLAGMKPIDEAAAAGDGGGRHKSTAAASRLAPASGEVSPGDVGDDAEDDHAGNGATGGTPRRRNRPKRADDALTLSHLVDYNHACMRAFRLQENKIFDAVHAALPRLVAPQKDKDKAPELNSVESSLRTLVQEANALSEASFRDDRSATKSLKQEPREMSKPVKDGVSQEAKQWWHNTIDKVDKRATDSSTTIGKTFMDRLVVALSQSDAEVSSQVSDLLRPWQQRIEQCVQAEIRQCATVAGEEQLRLALREGNGPALEQLQVAVNNAMAKAASTWSDEKIRKAAQRQRDATQVAALTEPALKDATEAVRNAICPNRRTDKLAAAAEADSALSEGLTSSLVARVRERTKPLEADLSRLAADAGSLQQDLQKCNSSMDRLEASVGTSASRSGAETSAEDPPVMSPEQQLAEKQEELLQLRKQANFEQAFEVALRWDELGPRYLLTEWLCDQVLRDTGSETPEEFLMVGGVRLQNGDAGQRLQSDRLKLFLMVALLQRSVAEGTSLVQAESNLEWVLCLQQQFELVPTARDAFTLVAGSMSAHLADLSQGRAPPSLVAATADDKKRLGKNARLAAKQLKMFQRTAQSS